MKKSLKHVAGIAAAAMLAVSATSTFAAGQTAGYHNSNAPSQAEAVRPGSLNYVEGRVSSNGQELAPQLVGRFYLQPNQSLETSDAGYAEVLLTPGAFLRIGPNSEIRMISVGLADTQVNLVRGNALVEADQVLPGGHLEVTVANDSVDLLKKGLYGFSVSPLAIKTFDGKADVISPAKSRQIGKHEEIAFETNNDGLKKTSFNESEAKREPLYVWSEVRSREEAAQNQLVAQNPNGYAIQGGGWFWNPYVNYYGFWPSSYLYSPFGFAFLGGYYPGFYGGYYGGFHRGFIGGSGQFHGFRGSTFHGGGFSGAHGNGVGRR